MRFRSVLFLSFSAISMAVGCRKPLTPNVDRNQAPETWITAAPQDTITVRDVDGSPKPPKIPDIPVKFHLYWAGSDPDGAVAGFYWAVVETLPLPPPGLSQIPPLPGPKPSDYHFTTRSDSTFIFRVSEAASSRQHAFFIYAVDNQGKADATPARVIFNAVDNFPPLPVIELAPNVLDPDLGIKVHGPRLAGATATGVVALIVNGVLETREVTVNINDSLTTSNSGIATSDTVPARSALTFHWRGEPTILGAEVTGFRYKLDEPAFVSAPVESAGKTYAAGVARPGLKVFTLRALDQAGWKGEISRRFQMNFTPDTWFAGPDPKDPALTRDPATGELYYDVPEWPSAERPHALNLPGNSTGNPRTSRGLLGCDSSAFLPSERSQRKTFYELYDPDGLGPLHGRIYVRQEFDTVHMNSWVIFYAGGSDLDSPYLVKVNPNDPRLHTTCDTTVLHRRADAVGSPIGFHQQYTVLLESGRLPPYESGSAQSPIYPLFDQASTVDAPRIGGYGAMQQSGKVYCVLRAEDGNGGQDSRVLDPRGLADPIDAMHGDPTQGLRSRVLVFYVDKTPFLMTDNPQFEPQPGQQYPTRLIHLNLLADDDDPYDITGPYSGDTGGPSPDPRNPSRLIKILRWFVKIRGQTRHPDGVVADTTYVPFATETFDPQMDIDLPAWLTSTQDTVVVELCDCERCELSPGTGRCITRGIPITVPPPSPSLGSAESSGSSPANAGSPQNRGSLPAPFPQFRNHGEPGSTKAPQRSVSP